MALASRNRIDLRIELNYQVDQAGADFVFNIHAARTAHQCIRQELLTLSQPVVPQLHTDMVSGNRSLRVHALPGPLSVVYTAQVDLLHHRADPASIAEVPVQQLPPELMGFIFPSRYCQSDRLGALANAEFGALSRGHQRVQAVENWVRQHVQFQSNSSNSTTSAIDTLIDRKGVCRDFTHLMIALCRALNIPARFATGTDYGCPPSMGAPDFQAYVEVYLGHRWYIFDPTGTAIPMGFVRFATGRDAADVAFATIFGNVMSQAPIVNTVALVDDSQGIVLPHPTLMALSTDAGPEG